MKTLRLLITLVISLTFLIIPVHAQEEMERTGFIVLVRQAETNTPFFAQTNKAFNQLKPRLKLLKHQGIISDFDANLETGMVSLKYAANADLGSLKDFEILTDIHAAAAQVPPIRPSASAEASGPRFVIYPYDNCFFVDNLATDSYLTVTLINQSGEKIAYTADSAGISNHVFDCFSSLEGAKSVLPKYKLVYKVYASQGGALKGTYSITVPYYQVTNIDQKSGLIQGIGPAGKEIQVAWYHDNLDASNSSSYFSTTAPISTSKTWSIQASPASLRGGDYLSLAIDYSSQIRFVFDQAVPYIGCALGMDSCGLNGYRFKNVTVQVTQAGATYTRSGNSNIKGEFYAPFIDNAGQPLSLKPGAKVAATGTLTSSLPTLTGVINFTSDQVKGKAPANKYFDVWVLYDYEWYHAWAKSDSAGNYVADFSSKVNLTPSGDLIIEIDYTDPVTGIDVYTLNQYVP